MGQCTGECVNDFPTDGCVREYSYEAVTKDWTHGSKGVFFLLILKVITGLPYFTRTYTVNRHTEHLSWRLNKIDYCAQKKKIFTVCTGDL